VKRDEGCGWDHKTSSVIRQGLSRDPHSVDASGQVSVLGPMSSLVKVEFWPQYRQTDESCSQILGLGSGPETKIAGQLGLWSQLGLWLQLTGMHSNCLNF